MAIRVGTWYKIGILEYFGVKHVQLSYFLSIALTIWLEIFYILCYIDLLIGFPFKCFSFPVTISLGLQLSNTTNESSTLAILLVSLLAFYYILFIILFSYTKYDRALVVTTLQYDINGVLKWVNKMDTYNIWWN